VQNKGYMAVAPLPPARIAVQYPGRRCRPVPSGWRSGIRRHMRLQRAVLLTHEAGFAASLLACINLKQRHNGGFQALILLDVGICSTSALGCTAAAVCRGCCVFTSAVASPSTRFGVRFQFSLLMSACSRASRAVILACRHRHGRTLTGRAVSSFET